MIQDSPYNLEVFETVDLLNRSAAEFIITTANKAIAERGKFTIALSGGNTPEKLYLLLSQSPFREQMQWGNIFIFWGDERCVFLTDEQNNAHRAKVLLLDNVNIPSANIHRIPVNLPPEVAATTYEQEIKDFFGTEYPQFDIILLGCGENGHTASLFPYSEVLAEKAEGIRTVFIEELKMFRITMTAPLINRAHNILFLVSGEKKAKTVKHVLSDSYQPEKYPAQLIKPMNGQLYWCIDNAASLLL